MSEERKEVGAEREESLKGNRGLSVRSNSSQSSGLKSRPGSCPYAPVAGGSGAVATRGREFPNSKP